MDYKKFTDYWTKTNRWIKCLGGIYIWVCYSMKVHSGFINKLDSLSLSELWVTMMHSAYFRARAPRDPLRKKICSFIKSHSVWKSLKKSHFTTWRAKRATFIFDFWRENSNIWKLAMRRLRRLLRGLRRTLFEMSIFFQKIQFWQNPNIFTSFSPNFFDNFSREIKVVNS